MAGLKIMTQGGYVPRVAAHLLADNEAQMALNTKLYSGDLRSWRKLGLLSPSITVQPDTKAIFKGKKSNGDPLWLSWLTDVDVVNNPLTDEDNPMSIYYTGDGAPKKTNSALAGSIQGNSPQNWLYMGVPAPTSAVTLAKGSASLGEIEVTNGGSGYAALPDVSIAGGGGSGATGVAVVTGGVVTGVTMTNEGAGYTSNPTITISGAGGGGATATPLRGKVTTVVVDDGGTGGQVASINITATGKDYTSAPTVVFTGGGTGAAATATVSGGKVTGITITSPGKNYLEPPEISFTGGGGSGATATAVMGTGYSVAPTITFSGPGSGAEATAFITNGVLTSIVVTNGGKGYTSAPSVSITGTGASGAIATATANTGVIAGVSITSGGSAYGPVVSFTGGGGNGAAAEPVVDNGVITSITLTNAGSGYTSEPTVTIAGGGGSSATAKAKFRTAETRVYTYTFVSEFGSILEESAPAPISSEVNISSGQEVILSNFAAPPQTNYNITKIRIYRSVTGSGATEFLFVDEISAPNTQYIDNKPSAQLGEVLPTLGWNEPPSDLRGLCLLPNQFMAGFKGNRVYFTPVNAFHTFPEEWSISVGSEIVGIDVFGQSLAVMTKNYPFIITGSSPESMSSERVPILEPCVSKTSIASDGSGVMYASPNGMCIISLGVQGLATGNLMLRDNFQKFNPSTIVGAMFDGKYFGFFTDGTEVIKEGAFILDRVIQATPLTLSSISASAVFVDDDSATLLLVSNNIIQRWEGDDVNTLPYEWLSKRFVFNSPANLGAIEVDGSFDDIGNVANLQKRIEEIIAANQALFATGAPLQGVLNAVAMNARDLNGSILQNIPQVVDDVYLLVDLYCDGKHIHTGQYVSNGVYRLPSGFKGQVFEVKLSGNIECRYVKLAETMKELKTL